MYGKDRIGPAQYFVWFQLQFVDESSNQLSRKHIICAVIPTHEQEELQWQSNACFEKVYS